MGMLQYTAHCRGQCAVGILQVVFFFEDDFFEEEMVMSVLSVMSVWIVYTQHDTTAHPWERGDISILFSMLFELKPTGWKIGRSLV